MNHPTIKESEKKGFRIWITLTSSLSVDKKYIDLTHRVASKIAEKKLGIVYGWTAYWMMLELAISYKSNWGADLVGVMAEDLMKSTKWYIAFDQLDEKHIVQTMEDRKKLIVEKSDWFLILPGWYGTIEEIGTIIWGKVNKLFDKPIAIFNLDGFYDKLLSFFSMIKKDKFSKIDYKDICFVSDNMEDILIYFKNYKKTELSDKFI